MYTFKRRHKATTQFKQCRDPLGDRDQPVEEDNTVLDSHYSVTLYHSHCGVFLAQCEAGYYSVLLPAYCMFNVGCWHSDKKPLLGRLPG